MRKSFKLENLDCANCAAKMETGINQLPGVNKASISFMTSKLIIDADTDDAEAFAAIVDAAQQVCTSPSTGEGFARAPGGAIFIPNPSKTSLNR